MREFKLIDSTFTIEEAKVVLLELINFKIQFHSQKIFSNDIKYGKDDIKSKKRIEELENIRAELLDYFENLDDSDGVVRVSSIVNMKPFIEIEVGVTQ